MIEITFKDFYELKFKDPGADLYIVKNGSDDILYIGISSDPIWVRWFGSLGHISRFPNSSLSDSGVGLKITDHLPESLKWKIQLWTHKDCSKFCRPFTESRNRTKLIPVKWCEMIMIQQLHPILNGTHNYQPGQDTTPISKRERERTKRLARISKDVFG